MRFVHELEQLVDHGLEKFPVSLEESGILADDVHDVAGDDGLVVLASFGLGQAQEILDDGHQEALFGFFVHGTRNGSNGPAERVAGIP